MTSASQYRGASEFSDARTPKQLRRRRPSCYSQNSGFTSPPVFRRRLDDSIESWFDPSPIGLANRSSITSNTFAGRYSIASDPYATRKSTDVNMVTPEADENQLPISRQSTARHAPYRLTVDTDREALLLNQDGAVMARKAERRVHFQRVRRPERALRDIADTQPCQNHRRVVGAFAPCQCVWEFEFASGYAWELFLLEASSAQVGKMLMAGNDRVEQNVPPAIFVLLDRLTVELLEELQSLQADTHFTPVDSPLPLISYRDNEMTPVPEDMLDAATPIFITPSTNLCIPRCPRESTRRRIPPPALINEERCGIILLQAAVASDLYRIQTLTLNYAAKIRSRMKDILYAAARIASQCPAIRYVCSLFAELMEVLRVTVGQVEAIGSRAILGEPFSWPMYDIVWPYLGVVVNHDTGELTMKYHELETRPESENT